MVKKEKETDDKVENKTVDEINPPIKQDKKIMAEKFTLYELVQKHGMEVDDLFIKLVDNGYFKQYCDEENLFKNNGFIEPTITLNEFKKIMNIK